MGMSTDIKGFIPDTDKDYLRHKRVLLACKENQVSLPKETAAYFNANMPDPYLLEEKLEVELQNGVHYKEWREDMQQGFEVDLTKLPQGVTKLRFYNCW
jgi:hypothetical protein